MIFKPTKYGIRFNIIGILCLFLVLLRYLFTVFLIIESFLCCSSEPLCVITEFAPYGDLLGFLRKKRGLRDDYYDIQQLPKRSLTSRLLMKFAWEIADGMAHLSAAKVWYSGCNLSLQPERSWSPLSLSLLLRHESLGMVLFKFKRNLRPNPCYKMTRTNVVQLKDLSLWEGKKKGVNLELNKNNINDLVFLLNCPLSISKN